MKLLQFNIFGSDNLYDRLILMNAEPGTTTLG